ncbi:rab-GTPase-TBC domain-containing protein [Baffinella frigidus]|nr:rab-GTPase-TBC domain-containing protein [Cryptophyta sp. CCMP2293]
MAEAAAAGVASMSINDAGQGAPGVTPSPHSGSGGSSRHEAAGRDIHGFSLDGKVSVAEYKAWLLRHEKTMIPKRGKWQELQKKYPAGNMAGDKSLKKLVRNGIVDGMRGQVWMELSGAERKWKECPALYQQLNQDDGAGSDEALTQIDLDIHRTFPDHVFFAGSPHDGDPIGKVGSSSLLGPLRRVLRAYARRNKAVGYCQGLNFIAGMMLLFVSEEQTFWLLATLLEQVLPKDYYARDLTGCNVDLRVFSSLLEKKLPKLHKHFLASGLSVEFFGLEWFIALFAKTLPTETLLRVWDCIFSEGYKVLFRVGIAVLQMNEKHLLSIQEPHDLFHEVQGLGRTLLDGDTLLKTAFAVYLQRSQVEESREKHLDVRRAIAGETALDSTPTAVSRP